MNLFAPNSKRDKFIALSGHVTCLHCDPFDGILMQLSGVKRVVLFPPSQLSNLYPFPVTAHLRHGLKRRASYSQVYPDRPDFDTFPKFRAAWQQRYEVILEAGDVLFIPVGWWHEVTALGKGLSVQPIASGACFPAHEGCDRGTNGEFTWAVCWRLLTFCGTC